MGGGTPSVDIGPGLGAFIAFFALALLLWLLMRNMNGRMRRMAYVERERVARLQEREAQLGGEASPSATTDTMTDSGATPAPDGAPAAGPSARGDDDDPEQPPALDR